MTWHLDAPYFQLFLQKIKNPDQRSSKISLLLLEMTVDWLYGAVRGSSQETGDSIFLVSDSLQQSLMNASAKSSLMVEL